VLAEHSTVATSAVRPNEPARQVIATFDNYADAERAVDYLSDQRVEVNRVAIVGRELEYVEQVLGRMNYGTAALRALERGSYDAALLDIRMPGISGIDVLGQIKQMSPDTQVIILTGQATVDTAVQALRLLIEIVRRSGLSIDFSAAEIALLRGTSGRMRTEAKPAVPARESAL